MIRRLRKQRYMKGNPGMKRNKSLKIERIAAIKLLLVLLAAIILLGGCRVDESDYEVTKYIGSSVKSFERKTKASLSQESNGVYSEEGSLQLIAPKGDITSITLLSGAQQYKLFGIGIGMPKADAEQKLSEVYGKETNKVIDASKNSVTQTYKNEESEFYISFDINSEKVVEISYYYEKPGEEEEEAALTNAGELIAMIGDIRVYYNEAMVYLKSAQENYEAEYGKGIWDVDIFGDGKSFGAYIKDEVIKQITQLKIIREKAKEYGITLSDEELADSGSYAREHFEGLSDKDVDRYLITKELLEQVYAENLLAEKMFETLTINVDTNVSDLETKQITIQHILVYGTEQDASGNRVPLSVESRESAFLKINNLLEKARNGEDFYSLAETNSEADTIEYTFGRGQGPDQYSDAFEQAAFTLKTGDISDIITTEYGWHILYCVSDFNEDATTQAKEKIIEERRTKMFSDLYSQWSTEYDVVINSETWDAIALSEE